MIAFTIASLGMAGLPLVAGFVSKWYILIGSIDGGQAIFAFVLLTSGMFNIGYFWPVIYQAFFQTPADSDAKPLIEFPIGGVTARADGGTKNANSTPEETTYAVDTNPSDHLTDETADHDDHHHGGPPPGGWERRSIGTESTWFMMAPISTAATGAIVLGIVPYAAVFLALVQQVVAGATGVVF
jgi:NADH-quinone oxidoreductase subunit L/multicomponent Na+:H+ antiporter subunit D